MPAVRDLTRDGRWSTYDVSVLKLSNVSFRGKCARTGNTLKLPSPTKLARLGHFPPTSQAGRLVGPVFYVYIFSLVELVLQVEEVIVLPAPSPSKLGRQSCWVACLLVCVSGNSHLASLSQCLQASLQRSEG
jgi:hypothetical protein